MALTRDDLDKGQCDASDHEGHEHGPLYMHLRCHPKAPPWTFYENGEVHYECSEPGCHEAGPSVLVARMVHPGDGPVVQFGPDYGTGFVIQNLSAFVAVHDDTDEGILAAMIEGTLMPLVGADDDRVRSLRPYAEAAATASGKPVRLVRFDNRTELEVIEP